MYEYMTEYERESAVFNAKVENAFMKIDFAFECAYREHEIRMNGIEAESYMIESSNDLSDMYARENEVFTEALKDLWKGFKKFIGGVLDKIKELLGIARDKANDGSDEAVQVPMDVKAAMEDQNKILHVLRNWASFTNPDGKPNTPKILAFIGAGTVGAGAVVYAVMKKKLNTQKEKAYQWAMSKIKGATDEANKKVDEFKGLLDNISKKAGDVLPPELKDLAKSFTDSATGVAQSLANAAKSAGNKISDAADAVGNAAKGVADKVVGSKKYPRAKVAMDAHAKDPDAAYGALKAMCDKQGIKHGTVLTPSHINKLAEVSTGESDHDAIQALRSAGANVYFESENQQDDADLKGKVTAESTNNTFNDLMSLINSL